MTIRERAAAALVRAREAGVPVPGTDPPYRRRLRAALARDIATLLAVPTTHVVVGDDPIRCYGGVPGQLITVHDPDDPDAVLRLLPETGNTGTGGGAYLLLDNCPGCSGNPHSTGQVPTAGDHRTRRPRPLPPLPAAQPRTAPGTRRVLRRPRPRTGLPTPITHPRARDRGVSGVRSEITTVGELAAALAAYPPQTHVRLAVAPGYPQATTVGVNACSRDNASEPELDAERVVWIGEGAQIGYLPEIARIALGHDWI